MQPRKHTRSPLQRLALQLALFAASAAPALAACSNDPGGSASNSGSTAAHSGGNASTGGTTTTLGGNPTGGNPTNSGGVPSLSGGASSTGGTSNSGGTTTGGISSMSGAGNAGTMSTSGGTLATGGTTPGTGGTAGSKGGNSGGGKGGQNSSGATSGGSAGASAGNDSKSGGAGGNSGGVNNGGSASAGSPAAGLSKDGEVKLTGSGLTLVSYGGYLNGESFQEEGILSFNGYQYTAFWNSSRHVVLARRALPSGAWATFEFTDYTNSADDAHNTISLGICPGDGTLHLSFDHHTNDLHYRKSVAGLVTNPGAATWAASSFSAVISNLVAGTPVTSVTYPRFVTEPGGSKMLFGARLGTSGSGDEHLWEYDSASHAWVSLGKYLDGISDNINGYPHGLSYTRGGTRLHVSWCWRATSDASTNYDLLYAYSDDNGRTWKNNAGTTVATTGSSFLRMNSAGIRVWTIAQNRGLINQEHMAVDPTGRVHVLLSHMPDAQANDSNFDSARTKSQFFHYFRNASGTWARTAIGLGVVANFRGKLAISSSNNLYAILPDLRIVGASAAANFATWTPLTSDSGRFFSDPLIDAARLLSEDKLSVFYPEKSSGNIWVLDYTLK